MLNSGDHDEHEDSLPIPVEAGINDIDIVDSFELQ